MNYEDCGYETLCSLVEPTEFPLKFLYVPSEFCKSMGWTPNPDCRDLCSLKPSRRRLPLSCWGLRRLRPSRSCHFASPPPHLSPVFSRGSGRDRLKPCRQHPLLLSSSQESCR